MTDLLYTIPRLVSSSHFNLSMKSYGSSCSEAKYSRQAIARTFLRKTLSTLYLSTLQTYLPYIILKVIAYHGNSGLGKTRKFSILDL